MYKCLFIFLALTHSLIATEELNIIGRIKHYEPEIKIESISPSLDPFQLNIKNHSPKEKTDQDNAQLRNDVIKVIGGENIGAIMHGRGNISSKVIINNWVFSPVDEILFPKGDGTVESPIEGKTILILRIEANKLVVRVSSEDGEDSIIIDVPFGEFFI